MGNLQRRQRVELLSASDFARKFLIEPAALDAPFKVKHWRAFQADNGWKGPPTLEFCELAEFGPNA
jgi:hypothetical protein